MPASRTRTTGGAPIWSPTPVESCCCGCSLREGVSIIAWLGVINGTFVIVMGHLIIRMISVLGLMMDAATEQRMELCLKEPSNPICQGPELPVEDLGGEANSLLIYPVIFAGTFEIVRSAVGLYASWHEQVAFARIYMRSWFVVVALALFTFVRGLANPVLGVFLCFHLPHLGLTLYFTMVAWSFYRMLKDKHQGPASDGDVAMRLMHA